MPRQLPDAVHRARISSDGGATFGPSKPLCACKGGGQFDPIIEVVPRTGSVYAVYMNGFNVVFVKSTNHGATWSAPVKTYGNVSWNDKPVLAMSDDGRDVYTPFNGPTGGDPWLAQSHDFGATWTQTKLVNSDRYFFAFDADVAPDGTVYLSQSSSCTAAAATRARRRPRTIDEHVFVSTNRGSSWTDRTWRRSSQGSPALRLAARRLLPRTHALTVDAGGAMILLYDGAPTAGGQQTGSATSTNRGAAWTAPVMISKAGGRPRARPPRRAPRVTSGPGGWRPTAARRRLERLVPPLDRRRRDLARAGEVLGCQDGCRVQDAGRLPRGLRRLRRDRDVTNTGKTIAIWGEGA